MSLLQAEDIETEEIIINKIECIIGQTSSNTFILDYEDIRKALQSFNIRYSIIKCNDTVMPSSILTFETIPTVKAYSTNKELTHYLSIENNQVMFVDEFNIINTERRLLYCDDNGNFKNLDCEYMYRKFKEKWVAVFENKEIEVATLNFAIYNILDTNDPFIIPLWKYSTESISSNLVKFNAFGFVESTLKAALIGLNLPTTDYDINSWSSSKYITLSVYNYTQQGEKSNNKIELLKFENLYDNEKMEYSSAVKKKEEYTNRIFGIIHIIEQNIIRKNLKPVYNDIYVISKLKSILHYAKRIESKSKTSSDHSAVLRELDTLINKIILTQANEKDNSISEQTK